MKTIDFNEIGGKMTDFQAKLHTIQSHLLENYRFSLKYNFPVESYSVQ